MDTLTNYESWEDDEASVATGDSQRQGDSEDEGPSLSDIFGIDEGDDRTLTNEESVNSPNLEVGISRSGGGWTHQKA